MNYAHTTSLKGAFDQQCAAQSAACLNEPATATQPELVAIGGRLQATYDELRSVEAMLSNSIERLQGPRPEQCAQESGPPVSGGFVGEANNFLDRIGWTLGQIVSDCHTLNRIV